MNIYFFIDPSRIKVVAAFSDEEVAREFAVQQGDVHLTKVYENYTEENKWNRKLLMVGRKITLDNLNEESEWIIDG